MTFRRDLNVFTPMVKYRMLSEQEVTETIFSELIIDNWILYILLVLMSERKREWESMCKTGLFSKH